MNSRVTLKDGGKGALYLVTFDHVFGEGCTLENHYVFKVIFDTINEISESKILFNEKFLSFAKKISLGKVCKRFDQMINDRTLRLSIAAKTIPQFK